MSEFIDLSRTVETVPVSAKMSKAAIKSYLGDGWVNPLDLGDRVFTGLTSPYTSQAYSENYVHIDGTFEVPTQHGEPVTYSGQLSFSRGILTSVLGVLGRDIPVNGLMRVPVEGSQPHTW